MYIYRESAYCWYFCCRFAKEYQSGTRTLARAANAKQEVSTSKVANSGYIINTYGLTALADADADADRW